MEFRLTYDGPLWAASASNSRAEHKHDIRRYLHNQLAQLWDTFPALSIIKVEPLYGVDATRPEIEVIAEQFARCGYQFVPLVTREKKLCCEIDILFLRREAPGAVVHGGDLDNRLKTLFDALRIPANCDEVKGPPPEPHEKPYFYCLLEDDQLITRITVTADRLLQPPREGDHGNNVQLVMAVKVKATDVTALNIPLIS